MGTLYNSCCWGATKGSHSQFSCATFFEQPEFDFDLKFLGGDIGALPGIEKMIDVSLSFSMITSDLCSV